MSWNNDYAQEIISSFDITLEENITGPFSIFDDIIIIIKSCLIFLIWAHWCWPFWKWFEFLKITHTSCERTILPSFLFRLEIHYAFRKFEIPAYANWKFLWYGLSTQVSRRLSFTDNVIEDDLIRNPDVFSEQNFHCFMHKWI